MIENPDTINNFVFEKRCIRSDSFIDNFQRILSKQILDITFTIEPIRERLSLKAVRNPT